MPAEGDSLNTEGIALFQAGNYSQALSRFREAHAKSLDPAVLFNIGKCQEALGDVDAAISTFESVARTPSANEKLVTRSQQRVALLRAAKAKASAPGAKGSQGTRAAPQPAVQASAEVEPAPTEWMGTVKWVAAGVSVAAIATGGLFMIMGNGDYGEVSDARDAGGTRAPLTRAQAQDLIDSGSSKLTTGYAIGGIGAGIGVAAAVLFLLDQPETTQVTPGVTSGGGVSLSLHGRF